MFLAVLLRATPTEKRGRRQARAERKIEMQGPPNDGHGCGRLYSPKMATPTCVPFYYGVTLMFLRGEVGSTLHTLEPGWPSVTVQPE